MEAGQLRRDINRANIYGIVMVLYLCAIIGFFFLVW